MLLLATGALGLIVSVGLVRLLWPLLIRYALARPNARSSHREPTPQGGGIAVLSATLVALATAAATGADLDRGILVVGAAAICLAGIGAVDDIRPLPALPRLLAQVICVAAVVLGADDRRILPAEIPIGVEDALLVLAGVWWVNLVNFMDGIDWITLAEFVPLTAALCLFGATGQIPVSGALVSAALLGGLLGFAPSNRPVARLFLGDVGSLPIGLLTGWLLLRLAASGACAAALLLALYYLADATLTLLLRLRRGERIWEAHRSHYYQRALDRGFSVLSVDGRIFTLNIALALLAAATLRWPGTAVDIGALALGIALVGWTLAVFSGGGSIRLR